MVVGREEDMMNPGFWVEQQAVVMPFCELKLGEEPRAEHGF